MEREVLSLPACHDGLGVISPTAKYEEHTLSTRLTAPLTALIMQQNSDLGDAQQQQQAIIAERYRRQVEAATELKSGLPQPLKGE